jgi:hypothetical protein
MSTKPETRLQRKIRKGLKRNVGGWWVKIHGGPFQAAGIPDLLGCVEGQFFALEVKRPDDTKGATEIQERVMKQIRTKGKGVSCVIESLEEAIHVVRSSLRKTKACRRLDEKDS